MGRERGAGEGRQGGRRTVKRTAQDDGSRVTRINYTRPLAFKSLFNCKRRCYLAASTILSTCAFALDTCRSLLLHHPTTETQARTISSAPAETGHPPIIYGRVRDIKYRGTRAREAARGDLILAIAREDSFFSVALLVALFPPLLFTRHRVAPPLYRLAPLSLVPLLFSTRVDDKRMDGRR